MGEPEASNTPWVWGEQELIAAIVPSNKLKVSFTEPETTLLHYLTEHQTITLSEFMELTPIINKRRAETILINFILIGTIKMTMTSQGTYFELSEAEE